MFALWLAADAALASSTRSYTGWNLPSGLAVLYRPDARFPVVRVVVAVRGGTADAPEGKRAVAHLAEHLAFRAVLDGEPIGVALRAAGCVSNATTGLDYTTYFMECPIDAADVPLRFALSLAVHDLPGLTDAAVAVEAQVVQHETTQRQDAGNYTSSRLTLPVFTGDHPYHIADAGLDEVVSVSLADVQGFFSRYYTPGNTVVVVEGDLLPHALAESVARLSGDGVADPRQRRGEVAVWPGGGGLAWLTLDDQPVLWFRDPTHPDQPLPRGPTIELIPAPAPAPPTPDTAPRRITVSGGRPSVVVAWYLPPAQRVNWWHLSNAADFASVDLDAALTGVPGVLASGCWASLGVRGSMLACEAILEDEEVQVAVGQKMASAFDGPYSGVRQLRVEAEASVEDQAQEVLFDLDDASVDALRAVAEYRLTTGLFDLYGPGARKSAHFWRDVYETWLSAGRATITYVDTEGRESLAGRARPPGVAAVAPRRAWPSPDPGPVSGSTAKEVVLPNGLRVVLLPLPGTPLSVWRLMTRAPPGSEELSAFLTDALRTPARVQRNEMLYKMETWAGDGVSAVGINLRGSWDPRLVVRSLWGTVQALETGNLDGAFRRTVGEVVLAGRSPEGWRTRLWRQAVRANPEADGLPELSAALAQKGVAEAVLKAQFRPEQATLVVGGKYDSETLDRIVEEMADWTVKPAAPVPETGRVTRVAPVAEVVVLDAARGGRTVDVGWMCPTTVPADNPYVVALAGELADARLSEAARSALGLGYSPYAWGAALWGKVDLRFVVETELGLEAQVLATIRTVAAELSSRPATAPELAAARRAVLSLEVIDATSTYDLSSEVAAAISPAGSLEGLRKRRAALEQVRAEDVAGMLRGCGEQGVAVVIGDAAAVQANLGATGLPVRQFDWRAAQLALVKQWAPARLPREEKWLKGEEG